MADCQELIERLRERNLTYVEQKQAADAIESLLAENGRLKAELAKYRDAPVVAWMYDEEGEKYFGHNEGYRPMLATPLIVKQGEEK